MSSAPQKLDDGRRLNCKRWCDCQCQQLGCGCNERPKPYVPIRPADAADRNHREEPS